MLLGFNFPFLEIENKTGHKAMDANTSPGTLMLGMLISISLRHMIFRHFFGKAEKAEHLLLSQAITPSGSLNNEHHNFKAYDHQHFFQSAISLIKSSPVIPTCLTV